MDIEGLCVFPCQVTLLFFCWLVLSFKFQESKLITPSWQITDEYGVMVNDSNCEYLPFNFNIWKTKQSKATTTNKQQTNMRPADVCRKASQRDLKVIKEEICLTWREYYFIISEVEILLQETGGGIRWNYLALRVVSESVVLQSC